VLPEGAQRIVKARLAGNKPAGPVFLNLTGEPVGIWGAAADPGRHPGRYDLRWVRGLWVVLVAYYADVLTWVNALLEHDPDWLEVFVSDRGFGYDVDASIKYGEHAFTWDEGHESFIVEQMCREAEACM